MTTHPIASTYPASGPEVLLRDCTLAALLATLTRSSCVTVRPALSLAVDRAAPTRAISDAAVCS